MIKGAKFSGDGKKKIGNSNFLALSRSIKTAMKTAAGNVKKGEWGPEEVKQHMINTLNHYKGQFIACKL